jgi:hypothetical protein
LSGVLFFSKTNYFNDLLSFFHLVLHAREIQHGNVATTRSVCSVRKKRILGKIFTPPKWSFASSQVNGLREQLTAIS